MPDRKPPSYVIGPLLRRAHSRAAQAFNAALTPLGIEGKHFGVLLVLHQAGPVSQRQLVDRLGADKSGMVRLIDDLEHRGLCRRQPDPTDRRAHAIELTPAGRDVFVIAEKTARKVSADLLAGLTDNEGAQLLHLLQRFTART